MGVKGLGLEDISIFWQASLKLQSVGLIRGCSFRAKGIWWDESQGVDRSGKGEKESSRWVQSL